MQIPAQPRERKAMDFYLVTGFLGAGKTTFLKKFVRLFPKQKIALVVNEFGREGVDGSLLEELHLTMREISNGSIFCSCRLDKFQEELERLLEHSPDLIITEASGLSDPTNIRRVLADYPQVAYRGSICLADSLNFQRVAGTARVCPKQLSVSSLVLLNKTDLVSEEQLRQVESAISALAPFAQIRRTSYGEFDPSWLSLISPNPEQEEAGSGRDLTLQKRDLLLSPAMSSTQCSSLLRLLCEDTYRMKGFLRLSDGMFLADCTGATVQLEPWPGIPPENTGHLTLLAGQGMNLRRTLKTAKELYGGLITEL